MKSLLALLFFTLSLFASIPSGAYDAQDHRIAKIVEGTTTTYLVDPNTPYARVIHESRDNGTEIDYSYGLRLLGDGEHTFLTDALGSTRALADGSGQITDSYDYTPYGELLRHSGTSDTPFLFTGEQYDPEDGLYYLRARYYSPELSRFLARDTYEGTLTDPLSQNAYLYARGNPRVYVDPSGHFFGGLASGMISMMATTLTNFNMVTAGSANLYVPVAISAYHIRIGMELRAEALNSIIFALAHSKIYYISNGKKSDSEQLIDLAYKKYKYATMLIRMGGLFADRTREAFKYIGYYTGFAKEIASYTKAQDYVTAYQAATAIVKAKQYELIKIANNLDLLRRSTPSITESIQNLILPPKNQTANFPFTFQLDKIQEYQDREFDNE